MDHSSQSNPVGVFRTGILTLTQGIGFLDGSCVRIRVVVVGSYDKIFWK